jgi:imidazole glycerol phosphate synthase subunit HisF
MKKILVVGLLCLVAVALPACKFAGRGIAGSGNRKTEKRDLKPFKAIDTQGAYEIIVTCQKPASFEIEADDNILPLIKTDVRDGVLSVTSDERYNAGKAVVLRITLPELTAVTSRGAGEVTIADANGDSLKIESMGAASVKAEGKVKAATISSTGAGDIDAAKLQAATAKVSVTGAASVNVFASEQLDVNVTGVGSVNYSGNPKIVNKSVGGFGSVNKVD